MCSINESSRNNLSLCMSKIPTPICTLIPNTFEKKNDLECAQWMNHGEKSGKKERWILPLCPLNYACCNDKELCGVSNTRPFVTFSFFLPSSLSPFPRLHPLAPDTYLPHSTFTANNTYVLHCICWWWSGGTCAIVLFPFPLVLWTRIYVCWEDFRRGESWKFSPCFQ